MRARRLRFAALPPTRVASKDLGSPSHRRFIPLHQPFCPILKFHDCLLPPSPIVLSHRNRQTPAYSLPGRGSTANEHATTHVKSHLPSTPGPRGAFSQIRNLQALYSALCDGASSLVNSAVQPCC